MRFQLKQNKKENCIKFWENDFKRELAMMFSTQNPMQQVFHSGKDVGGSGALEPTVASCNLHILFTCISQEW